MQYRRFLAIVFGHVNNDFDPRVLVSATTATAAVGSRASSFTRRARATTETSTKFVEPDSARYVAPLVCLAMLQKVTGLGSKRCSGSSYGCGNRLLLIASSVASLLESSWCCFGISSTRRRRLAQTASKLVGELAGAVLSASLS